MMGGKRMDTYRPSTAGGVTYYDNFYSLNWLLAIPLSVFTFFASFAIAIFAPWMVILFGNLGLDAVMRNYLVRNAGADLNLNSMELLMNPSRFFVRRAVTYAIRMAALYFLGPMILLGSLLGGGLYMLSQSHRFHGTGLVLLSAVPGLLLTCLWWGFWWYVLTPFVHLGIAIAEFSWVGYTYLRLRGVDTHRMREKSRELIDSGKETFDRIGQRGTETVRDLTRRGQGIYQGAKEGARRPEQYPQQGLMADTQSKLGEVSSEMRQDLPGGRPYQVPITEPGMQKTFTDTSVSHPVVETRRE
jgi:hypothetical protein